MLSYISVDLLILGLAGLVTGAVWSMCNKSQRQANLIGQLCGVSAAFMVNSCLLLYIAVHTPNTLTIIFAIIIAELLAYGGYFIVNGCMQSLNKPSLVDKTFNDLKKEKSSSN